VKKFAVILTLIFSLLAPTALPANASEKCLANFADSEWANGTPSGVKNLLGFDLVEKITKTPGRIPSPIDTFYLLGEHTEKITYNYVGKNCTTREVVVLGRFVTEQSLKFGYQTIDEFINKKAPNFMVQENSRKYYSNIKNYFSNTTFNIKARQIPSQDHILGSTRFIQGYLIREVSKFQEPPLWPDAAFIYFPNKCGFWNIYDDNGNESKEKFYSGGVGRYPSGGVIKFESDGVCLAELRQGGGIFSVAEKIADIKYVVASSPSTTTITCKKGNTTKKVKGINPKCPKGFKST
jgi:hypothetical protein